MKFISDAFLTFVKAYFSKNLVQVCNKLKNVEHKPHLQPLTGASDL